MCSTLHCISKKVGEFSLFRWELTAQLVSEGFHGRTEAVDHESLLPVSTLGHLQGASTLPKRPALGHRPRRR